MKLSVAALTVVSVLGLSGSLLSCPLPCAVPVALAGTITGQPDAATQTTTFVVENMTCALCPVTVRTAMEHVHGVKSVTVDFNAKTATVVFDPALATPDQIAKASSDAGYPARPAL